MKVLVIGSGGREYSIGLALTKDPEVSGIYFAPGNGATAQLGKNVALKGNRELADFAKTEQVGLTIVGPEAPLTDGIVDVFRAEGLDIFGPTQEAAKLEGSKAFMKNFASKYDIPTAKYLETSDLEKAEAFIKTLTPPVVVKADGLCAGKGVIIAKSHEEAIKTAEDMLSGNSFGDAGNVVVVEEFLDGFELSVFAICDGKDFITLPAAQDHKRLLDKDEGPNTGGMGAYAPTPLAGEALMEKIRERIIKRAVDGMAQEGTPFEGVLFCGVMVVEGEPILLEYNVRFGDPECEILMPLLKTPLGQMLYKAATGKLDEISVEVEANYAVGVVLASAKYPYGSSAPQPIHVEEVLPENSHIAYAGVSEEDGNLMATGGRVLVCVGKGATIKDAHKQAYALCEHVKFQGAQYRNDIAYQVL